MPVETKPFWQSKVVVMNIIMAIAMVLIQFPAFAAAGEFLKQYFAEAGMGWAILNMILRVFKSNVSF